MAKQKLPWLEAHVAASLVIDHLQPHCDRVEIAGSIRRKCAEVGDIEIVCIPRLISNEQKTLFPGDEGELIITWPGDECVHTIADENSLVKDGERYKQFAYNGRQVDLFLTTKEQWGLIFAIRTGPAEFSQKIVTQKSKGGYLLDICQVRDGWLKVWKDDPGVFLSHPTCTEDEFFAFTTLKKALAPEDRK